MILRSVNVSRITQVLHQGELVSTGIFKKPVAGPVQVCPEHVEGDTQADLKHHGGPDKAVYGYPWEHYAYWADQLERDDLVPGQFGENLTTEGVLESRLCIGDRVRIGSVLLEVSQPRMPCFKLGIRMQNAGFPRLFLQSGLVGFYFRVLEAGTVEAGEPIVVDPSEHVRTSVQQVSHVRFFDNRNREAMETILSNPALAAVWRKDFEDLLANRR